MIRIYTSSLTSDFTLYSYNETLSYELNKLVQSRSQSGNFYPQPFSNLTTGNKKRTLSFVIEYIDDDEKESLMEFFDHVEGGKEFTLVITNDIEEIYNFTAKFDDGLKFNMPDIDYWNCTMKIREV